MADILAQILADPIVNSIAMALGVVAVALWLAAAWWAYGDATRRTESAFLALGAAAWIVLSTPLFLPLALLIYLSVRPGISAADERSQRLAILLTASSAGPACRACAASIQPAWRRCPACASWLAAPCASCGAWSDPTFDICPLCGDEARGEPLVVPMPALAPSAHRVGRRPAAAGGLPAAAGITHAGAGQRGVRMAASSERPSSYAASRESLSAPS